MASSKASSVSPPAPATRPGIGPFLSLRDYIAALDARGLLLRIEEFDQDAYESTAFAYRLIERRGYMNAPAFLFDRVKVDGRWLDGPIIGGAYGPWLGEALCFGIDEYAAPQDAFAATLRKVVSLRGPDGFPHIPPREVSADDAPVKQVRLTGTGIDLTAFPFLQTNPQDAGRYINSGSLILQDPELGAKISVYRCQLQGPRRISVNPEPGQGGWRFLQRLIERGDKTARGLLVLGVDPITYGVAGAAVAVDGQTELGVAGGLIGQALPVVRAENSDIIVPANAEMVIEGEIPLHNMLPEGPFAEFYGVMGGAKDANFFMDVQTITHRESPWFLNSYSGVIRNAIGATREATLFVKYRDLIPGLQAIHVPQQAAAVHIVSIDKQSPGQGMAAGEIYAEGEMLAKVVVVVDREITPYRLDEIWQTLGARWQPYPAARIIQDAKGIPLEPSQAEPGKTSKIVIDATPQLPEEGGPAVTPGNSKRIFQDDMPGALERIDDLLDDLGV
ncbi:MAG: UbiD family decarboxylase [Gammaproteobacteria bacterium]|nr:UbiD family decarboxylase [Gammaproteobacteria bacterium]